MSGGQDHRDTRQSQTAKEAGKKKHQRGGCLHLPPSCRRLSGLWPEVLIKSFACKEQEASNSLLSSNLITRVDTLPFFLQSWIKAA